MFADGLLILCKAYPKSLHYVMGALNAFMEVVDSSKLAKFISGVWRMLSRIAITMSAGY